MWLWVLSILRQVTLELRDSEACELEDLLPGELNLSWVALVVLNPVDL